MKTKILGGIAIAIALTTACIKDNETEKGPYTSLNDALLSIKPSKQIKTINASTGGVAILANGTKIYVPANAFVTLAGSAVSGNVSIEAMEILNKTDMMLSGILPIATGDNQLISGGEIGVRVKDATGNILKLAPSKYLQYAIPQGGPADLNNSLFVGPLPNENNDFVWAKADSNSSSSYLVCDGDTIRIFDDSLRWVNADYFLANPNYVSFEITINGAKPEGGVINTFASYDGKNAAWRIINGPDANNIITEDHVADIPCQLVTYFIADGNLYFGKTGVTPVNNGKYTINVSKVNPTELKAGLASLP
jgi:hypothetical protein